MSEISFNTVLTTLLISNLLFSLSCLLFSNSNLILAVGYKTVLFILLLSVLRLLLPIDFTFTTNILMKGLPSEISSFIRTPRTASLGIHFSIWNILLLIWGCGTLIQAFLYFRQYKKIHAIISTAGKDVTLDKKYTQILASVQAAYGIHQHFTLVELPFLSSPMLFSIRRPCIFLPAQNNYCETDLTYIFRHELTHFKHHDLLYKLFFQLVFIIYWWNPLKYLLQKQLNSLLEINVDSNLTKDPSDLIPYMECLVNVKKQSITSTEKQFNHYMLSLNNFKKSMLEKRFDLLARGAKQKHFYSLFFVFASILIFLLSYCFTLEPSALPVSTDTEQIFILTEENAYAVPNDDGTYDLYLYGEYLETVDSLKYYSSIPIKAKDNN